MFHRFDFLVNNFGRGICEFVNIMIIGILKNSLSTQKYIHVATTAVSTY